MVGNVEGTLTLSAEDLDRGDADKPERAALRFSLSMMGLVFVAQGLPRALEDRSDHGSAGSGLVFTLAGFAIIAMAQLTAIVKPGKRRLAALGEGERDVTYRFDEHGARISTRASELILRYRTLSGYVEGKSAFLLYTDDVRAEVIPKRAFSSAELEQIRGWLRTYSRLRSQVKWKRQTLVAALIVGFLAALMTATLALRAR
jgi:YcxB-like protein